jgi:hypothetical protein
MFPQTLLAIESLPAWWERHAVDGGTNPPERAAAAYRERLARLWSAWQQAGRPVRYLLGSDGNRCVCGFAFEDAADAAGTMEPLAAAVPGIRIGPADAARFRRNWATPLCLTGAPEPVATAPPGAAVRLLRLLDGRPFLLYGEFWPANREWVRSALREAERLADEARYVNMRNPRSGSEQDLRTREKLVERYRRADGGGGFRCFVALLAETERDRDLAAANLLSAWRGAGETCVPAGWEKLNGNKVWTMMLNEEVLEVAHFPLESHRGYELVSGVRLESTPPEGPASGVPSIALGEIEDIQAPTGRLLEVPLSTIFRHVGFFGSPGSGKTNALQAPLIQAWKRHGVPFLVIEPSIKREFRALAAESWAQPLQLFRLGDPLCPLRLNLLQPQGVPLATHIGNLKSLLLGVFAWVAPQQYVLEDALHRVYEERGFDLTTGVNRRGSGASQWPTLDDLDQTIARSAQSSNYDRQITGNLIAGLRTRLRTLAHGPVGQVLNCRRSLPMDELLASPAVVELALLGSEEEKALLMGALLMAVAEHRMANGPAVPGHVIVVEEAHRLLRNTTLDRTDETADPRGAMLGSFVNLIAELRAFRQGVWVVEQSPQQLHPAVPANLNLTVCLRLGSDADVQLAGRNMQLDEARRQLLGTLPVGRAIVGGAGVTPARRIRLPHIPFAEVSRARLEASARDLDARYPGAQSIHRPGGARQEHACQLALPAADEKKARRAALGCMLAVAAGDHPREIVVFAVAALRGLASDAACCAMQRAADAALSRKGVAGCLSLEHEDRLYDLWVRFSQGVAGARSSGSELAGVAAALVRTTAEWRMVASRRNLSCHRSCTAWLEARWLAAEMAGASEVPGLPPQAARCFHAACAP